MKSQLLQTYVQLATSDILEILMNTFIYAVVILLVIFVIEKSVGLAFGRVAEELEKRAIFEIAVAFWMIILGAVVLHGTI